MYKGGGNNTESKQKLKQLHKQSLMLAEQVLHLSQENNKLKTVLNHGMAPDQIKAIENAYSNIQSTDSFFDMSGANINSVLSNVKDMISTIDDSLYHKSPGKLQIISNKPFKLTQQTPQF